MRFFSKAHLADEALAHAEAVRDVLALGEGVGGDEIEHRLALVVVDDVEHAALGVHERRDLGQDQVRDGDEVALALQHAGEAGEVRLQPILLGVLQRRVAQVADHLVDVVLERGDLARGLDGDRPGEVALGHGGRDVGDGAHLGREVRRELVDVVGEVAPQAGGAGHARLAAELALDADLAGDVRHLVGEGRERVDHLVDGVGERRDLALGVDRRACA